MDRSIATRPDSPRGDIHLRTLAALLVCYALAGFVWWNTLGCSVLPPYGEVQASAQPESAGTVSIACEIHNRDGTSAGSDCPGGTQTSALEEEVYGACLTAEPAAAFSFWAGNCGCSPGGSIYPNDCSGASQCELSVPPGALIECVAHFSCDDETALSVEVIGAGSVESTPAGIHCRSGICVSSFCGSPPAQEATLTATVREGSGQFFAGWEGDPDCADGVVTMDADHSCVARFRQPQVVVTVLGAGRVAGPGLDCREGSPPEDCEGAFPTGGSAQLLAYADAGAHLIGWGGDCLGTDPRQDPTADPNGNDLDLACTAEFSAAGPGTDAVVGIVSVADDESLGNSEVNVGFGPGQLSGSEDLSIVGFRSNATNLVGAPQPAALGYARDLAAGTTQRITRSLPIFATPADVWLSADGRFAAYELSVPDFLAGFVTDIFRWDLLSGTEEQISLYDAASQVGTYAAGRGTHPAISGGGRFVAFNTEVAGGRNGTAVRDTCTGAPPAEICTPHSVAVSIDPDGTLLDDVTGPPRLSRDGRFVLFRGTRHGAASPEFFLHDRDSDANGIFDEPGAVATIEATPDPGGGMLELSSDFRYDLDASGRYLAFESPDPDLPDNADPAPYWGRSFLRDTCAGAPPGCVPSYTALSVRQDGTPVDQYLSTYLADFSGSGRYVAFTTYDPLLVSDDPGFFLFLTETVVRDTCVGAPTGCTPTNFLVSRYADGSALSAASTWPQLSDDGQLAVFYGRRDMVVPTPNPYLTEVVLAETGIPLEPGGTPSIASRSPGNAPAGSPELLLRIGGQGFAPGASVLWNGAPHQAIFVSPSKLEVRLDAAELAAPGVRMFRVANPGGLTSSQVSFVVD